MLFASFHSINIPSEWGQNIMTEMEEVNFILVSIQLISPASGDQIKITEKSSFALLEFPFN